MIKALNTPQNKDNTNINIILNNATISQ